MTAPLACVAALLVGARRRGRVPITRVVREARAAHGRRVVPAAREQVGARVVPAAAVAPGTAVGRGPRPELETEIPETAPPVGIPGTARALGDPADRGPR
jgi:hypothetical protein